MPREVPERVRIDAEAAAASHHTHPVVPGRLGRTRETGGEESDLVSVLGEDLGGALDEGLGATGLRVLPVPPGQIEDAQRPAGKAIAVDHVGTFPGSPTAAQPGCYSPLG